MDNAAEELITLELEKRSSEDFEQRPMKRARVALACQRCRTCKQKCDGAQDSCSTCTRLGLRCHCKAHLTPKPDQKKQYIAALEDRIADLENFLSSLGHESIGDDHLWKQRQYQFQDEGQAQEEQQGDEIGISSEIREYGPTSENSYAGRKMSVNRVLGSIVETQKSQKSEHERRQNPPNRSELIAMSGPMFASPVIADRLLDGWILETIGETGPFWPEERYEAPLVRMDAVLSLNDTRSVAYLLLMTLFWACYYLDREMSVALARSPAIADNNIDVEFPVDINEDVDDLDTRKCAMQIIGPVP